MDGKIRNAFCAIRPPGHHALKDKAMGFCLFNNVAIAAKYLQQKHKIGKVLIVDWDVHHGNGTQAIFDDDPTVFYFSVHQSPFYPGTGSAADQGVGTAPGRVLFYKPVALRRCNCIHCLSCLKPNGQELGVMESSASPGRRKRRPPRHPYGPGTSQ
jgi:histone deacetylase-like protein